MRRANATGFTLIELVVVIAVVAILASIAMPSFKYMLQSNRVSTASNQLLGTLALARMEAIRTANMARVCPSTTGTSCNGSDWSSGVLVITDANGDGTPETVARFVQGTASLNLQMSAGAPTTGIDYDSRGRPGGTASYQFTLVPQNCTAGTPLFKTLSITAAGQVNMQTSNCT